MRTSAAAAAVVALTLGLGASGAVATPASNGPIYFVGSRATDFFPEVYSVAADGSGRLDLTNNPAADESPAISPDGRQIAFVSTRDGYQDVFVMNAAGSEAHRVCPQASLPAGPCITDEGGEGAIADLAWSPTGRTLAVRVVFPGEAICHGASLDANYLVDLPDGHPRRFGYWGLLGPLRFSSDGRFVVSASWSCISGGSLSVARADSGKQTGGVSGLFEDWAPRGLRLLYERGKRVDEENPYPTLYPATMDPFGRHRWTLRRIPETAPTWSPSGKRIAFFRSSGPRKGLYVAHVGRQDARRLRRFGYPVYRSAWSPDGKWIAFGGGEGTYFVRSDGAGLQRLNGALLSPESALIWSPDSSHFAFVDRDGAVRVVSPPQGQAVAVTTASNDLGVCRVGIDVPVCQIAWAGDRLVFASHAPQTTHLFAVEQDGSGLRQVAPDTAPPGQVSPDGSRVAFVRDSHVWTARLDGSDEQQVTSGALSDASPAWSPDGAQIAFLRQTSTPSPGYYQIFSVGASGGSVHQVTNPDSTIQVGNWAGHLAWSPDGSWLLLDRLLVHPDGSGLHHLLGVPDSCRCEPYGWSADGTKLALGGNELAVMNVDGSGFRQLTEPSAGGADEPAWSPDGTKLVFVRWSVPACLREPTCDRDLWTINADGSGEEQLTVGPWPDTVPTWLARP